MDGIVAVSAHPYSLLAVVFRIVIFDPPFFMHGFGDEVVECQRNGSEAKAAILWWCLSHF